jgi:hypothetical protein
LVHHEKRFLSRRQGGSWRIRRFSFYKCKNFKWLIFCLLRALFGGRRGLFVDLRQEIGGLFFEVLREAVGPPRGDTVPHALSLDVSLIR